MRAWIRPFLLLSAALLLAVPLLQAQVHGVPASVSSFGFGGNFRSAPGVAASVTSLGPNGFGNSPAVFGRCCFNTFRMGGHSPVFVGRHRGNRGAFFAGAVPVYTLPYTQVVVVQPETAVYDDEDDQGGPVILERQSSRTTGVRERIVEEERAPTAAAAVAAAPAEPVTPQPSTLLIFKDGHKAEVGNYAIVGDTLFNFSESRSYKILLADLDLAATRKANAERGVDFQLPAGSR